MRLLGIDFGFKRIGLAIAETEFGIISARPPLEASGILRKDAEKIAAMAGSEQVDCVILGLPLLQGEEGKMAKICRRLGDEISILGYEVGYVDEAMSSVEADQVWRGEGMKASERRKVKDSEAARLILERYIHEQKID